MDVLVIIPRLAVEEQLHEPYAVLDKPPCDQAARAVFTGGILIDAVQFFRRRAFAADIERLRGCSLHPGSQFVTVDARLERVFSGALGQVGLVELTEEVKVVALDVALQVGRRVEVEYSRLLRAQHRALIQAWQEAVGPVVHAIDRVTAGVGQHHVGRQLVRHAAKRVCQPGAEARPAQHGWDAGVHVADGDLVAVVSGVHAADHAKVIGDAGRVRQQLAEIHPALAVFLEFPRAAEQVAAGFVGEAVMHVAAVLLAVETRQFRLGIGEIHVARAAVHEERNHRLRLRSVVRLFWREVERLFSTRNRRRSGEQFVAVQQPAQRQAADAHRVVPEKPAAVEGFARVVHASSSSTTRAGWPSMRLCTRPPRLYLRWLWSRPNSCSSVA